MLTKLSTDDDLLSATLAKLKLDAISISTIDASGRWALALPAVPVIRLHVIVSGQCWLALEGAHAKHPLRTGDAFVITHPNNLILSSDPTHRKPTPLRRAIRSAEAGVIRIACNNGGEFLAAGVAFQLDGPFQDVVLGRLPSLIHIPSHVEQAAVLRWGIERFAAELVAAQPGFTLVLQHLAPIMLLQTLRCYLATASHARNWLVAISEPRLRRALVAMQSEYARAWSLDALAKIAGLSRAGFALNFKKCVGIAPLEYLTRWRVQVACELLADRDRRIAEVARTVGYESESAFSAAFTRIIGTRPGQYRRA